MSEKRKCLFCEREISVNGLTGGLRFHKVAKDGPKDGLLIIPDEACPGIGSNGATSELLYNGKPMSWWIVAS
jgi:hypothetical protein